MTVYDQEFIDFVIKLGSAIAVVHGNESRLERVAEALFAEACAANNALLLRSGQSVTDAEIRHRYEQVAGLADAAQQFYTQVLNRPCKITYALGSPLLVFEAHILRSQESKTQQNIVLFEQDQLLRKLFTIYLNFS